MIRIEQLLTGAVAPLGPDAAPSAIWKRPVTGRVWLDREGLEGDSQGDRKHHGGLDKAVHAYPFEHYRHWTRTLGADARPQGPGAFGENFSSRGHTEAAVAVGDTYRFGEALIQVSQGRQPCWKLNLRFGVPDMAERVQRSGRCGWYYRVLEPGFIIAGEPLILVERRSPEWTLQRLWRAFYVDPLNREELDGIARLEHLPQSWREHARRRLASGEVEDWSRRLKGAAPAR